MKRRLLINRILALLVCGVMCVSCVMPAAAAPAEAEENAEIRLTEVKGNVTVINGSGREIPYAVDMAPDNGDHVKTQESSYLWMNLGNGSVAKMDAQSGVEFRTSGSKKELLLDEGSLYFNILGEDINIRTTAAALNVQNACGWIRAADREHTLICILSGEGAYSVTDPVDGQVRSEALNSGDLAECLVYPQEQEGDKCDTTLRRFGEDDVASFVLAELAEDPQLLGQIVEVSDVDLSSQAEAAQSRLQEEESGLQQKLDELNGNLEKQENNIAKDPTWEGGVEPEEDIVAGAEIPLPAPRVKSTFGEEILAPFPSASPAVPSPESKNGSNNKSEPRQGESAAAPSRPAADSDNKPEYSPDNEPEPGQGESATVPSEPVTNPDSAPTGPNNSLVVKGISKNQGFVRVGKDGQIVFKDTFTNTTSSSWVENEGQITFEENLNNEDWACITNKAQIIAKKDICNYDHAHIRNKGQIKAEKDVYNGLAGNDKSFIYTNEPESRFDVAGKYVNGNASLSMTGGTISECGQSDGDVEILSDSVTVKNGYVITGGSLNMSAGTLEAGSSNAALTVNISSSGATGSSEGVNIYGGTIFGNGSGKAAISAVSGNITMGSPDVSADAGDGGSPYGPVAVKAYNIFDTLRSDGENWNAVMNLHNHLKDMYEADCDSPIYVGRKEGSFVYLGCVSNKFSDVAEYADHGDIITLKDNVNYEDNMNYDGFSQKINGSEATLDLNCKQLEAAIYFENASWVINGEGGSFIGGIEMVGGSLDLSGGNYKYKETGRDVSIILIKDGNLNLKDGIRLDGRAEPASPLIISAESETQVTIGSADIDSGYTALNAWTEGEGTVTLTIEDGARISSTSQDGTVYFHWKEEKCSLNLNGGSIENEYYSSYIVGGKLSVASGPALRLNTKNSNIPSCLSEIHTKLSSAPREDMNGTAIAVRIGNKAYKTVLDGNCWRLELIDPDIGKASEASIMNEEANPPEDEELTEPETNETLEAENPEESKDSEDEENSEESKDSEDEENPDEPKDPSESEDLSEPKDPSGSEDPKKPAEGGGDESGSGDKETPPGGGDEGGSGDKETPPGGGDVLTPENAGDKKEEEPTGDEGAGKEGEAAREQSE